MTSVIGNGLLAGKFFKFIFEKKNTASLKYRLFFNSVFFFFIYLIINVMLDNHNDHLTAKHLISSDHHVFSTYLRDISHYGMEIRG